MRPRVHLEQVQFMRVPVAGFVGHEIDALEYSPEDQAVERQKNSVFEDTSELAHAGGSLIPGSLRENALTRVWYKLDLQRIGHIDNLMTASGNSLVVLQNRKNHVADLTAYEPFDGTNVAVRQPKSKGAVEVCDFSCENIEKFV